jgi:hypothetical protein
VDFAFNGVERNWVMGGVGSEDCDGIAGGEGVDGGFVGIGVGFVVCGE